MTHTPGPWIIGIDDEPAEGLKGIEINTDDGKTNIGYVMAQEIDYYTPVDRANAAIICATPEMLEALKEAHPYITSDIIRAKVGNIIIKATGENV